MRLLLLGAHVKGVRTYEDLVSCTLGRGGNQVLAMHLLDSARCVVLQSAGRQAAALSDQKQAAASSTRKHLLPLGMCTQQNRRACRCALEAILQGSAGMPKQNPARDAADSCTFQR